MNEEFNLYDMDILTFQTILLLVDKNDFFKEIFKGLQVDMNSIPEILASSQQSTTGNSSV